MLGVVHQAKAAGAATVGISCNPGSALEAAADVAKRGGAGGDRGSSRLKGGAAKMILNMISTASMVKLGRVIRTS